MGNYIKTEGAKIFRVEGDENAFGFDCPGCGHSHSFSTDRLGLWPGWSFNGDIFNPNVTPSLLFWTDNSRCHSYITNGSIQFLSDCSHSLAGKIVELPITQIDDSSEESQTERRNDA